MGVRSYSRVVEVGRIRMGKQLDFLARLGFPERKRRKYTMAEINDAFVSAWERIDKRGKETTIYAKFKYQGSSETTVPPIQRTCSSNEGGRILLR